MWQHGSTWGSSTDWRCKNTWRYMCAVYGQNWDLSFRNLVKYMLLCQACCVEWNEIQLRNKIKLKIIKREMIVRKCFVVCTVVCRSCGWKVPQTYRFDLLQVMFCVVLCCPSLFSFVLEVWFVDIGVGVALVFDMYCLLFGRPENSICIACIVVRKTRKFDMYCLFSCSEDPKIRYVLPV
jgi:hypothetical protein